MKFKWIGLYFIMFGPFTSVEKTDRVKTEVKEPRGRAHQGFGSKIAKRDRM